MISDYNGMVSNYNDHKRFLILNIINHLGAASRTRLAVLTGYQPASITLLTKQLINEHILVETGARSVGSGRKRILLEINKSRLCAISVSFSVSVITFTVAQFDGAILTEINIDFPKNPSESEFLSHIITNVRLLLDAYQDQNIIGIGICTPSNDPASYPIAHFRPAYPRLGDWIHKVLLPELKDSFSIPVSVFYDVTLAIMAAQNFGAAKGVNDFICVELSNGIGCSICCNGKAVSGANGFAGELGHTVIQTGGAADRLCYCGKPSCVEAYYSFPELVKSIRRALQQNVHTKLSFENDSEITARDIRRAIEAGDQMCRYYVKQFASSLGIAIANAVMLLNPKLILLYGHMLELGDYFLDVLKTAIYENTSLDIDINITASPELEKLLPLGAVAELFSLYLKRDNYSWVYQLPIMTDETQGMYDEK